MRTQVGIVGAGPAGLTLALLLRRAGIESVVLEARDRAYVERRVRAGVLEQGTVDLLRELGVAERLEREGLVHHGIYLQFDGARHHIPMSELTGGRAITIYGQQELVKDLIAERLASGGELLFEVEDVTLHGIESESPRITFSQGGESHELACDVIAGCDGFHGVSRASVPAQALTEHELVYPFAWLGILAQVAPSTDELIYSRHESGFALHSLRSPELSRLYIQCHPSEDIAEWQDERIWSELQARLGMEGWTLHEGPIIEKGITPLRSYVAEPMRHGRLFLAGDAAHIVPATGAKGLNLAVADVRALAQALSEWFERGDERLLDAYSDTCLKRVWRVQHFSWWMSTMLHPHPGGSSFEHELQRSQLRYLTSSRAAATTLAENYVGLELA